MVVKKAGDRYYGSYCGGSSSGWRYSTPLALDLCYKIENSCSVCFWGRFKVGAPLVSKGDFEFSQGVYLGLWNEVRL